MTPWSLYIWPRLNQWSYASFKSSMGFWMVYGLLHLKIVRFSMDDSDFFDGEEDVK